jgi:dephospho-CoA kinase
MPADEKLKFATEKIDSSGSLEETQRQVEELAGRLQRGCVGSVQVREQEPRKE